MPSRLCLVLKNGDSDKEEYTVDLICGININRDRAGDSWVAAARREIGSLGQKSKMMIAPAPGTKVIVDSSR